MRIAFCLLTVAFLLSACISGIDRGDGDFRRSARKILVVSEASRAILEGPYEVEKVHSITRIEALFPSGSTEVLLRGIRPFSNFDSSEAEGGLRARFRMLPIYIHTNAMVKLANDGISTVVSVPTTQVCRGLDAAGQLVDEPVNWEILQVKLLLTGNAMVDASDTNHVYYDDFIRAEALAKKYKKGYWKTHTDNSGHICPK